MNHVRRIRWWVYPLFGGYPLDLPANEIVYRDTIAMAKVDGADAIMVGDNPDAMNNRVLIAKLIDATGLPATYPFAEFVSAGGLMAYSFDLIELNKRVADDIAVILNGTNPGGIPFYQAVKFELSLYLKTARALSLDVPATLLLPSRDREQRAATEAVVLTPCHH